jgi:MarR family transcriptional regulator, organic hydroperoxide resistance regulator
VSGSQLWLLEEVAQTPGIGVSELAERLSIHQSTCSQFVDRLVRNRLLLKQRSSSDQRRVGLRVSEDGAALIGSAPLPVQGVLPNALASMAPEELTALNRSLSRVIAQLRDRGEQFADEPLSDL